MLGSSEAAHGLITFYLLWPANRLPRSCQTCMYDLLWCHPMRRSWGRSEGQLEWWYLTLAVLPLSTDVILTNGQMGKAESLEMVV